MSLYLLQDRVNPVKFYARKPEDIVKTIEYYHERESARIQSPEIAEVFKTIPKAEDIPQVELGEFYFSVGMVVMKNTEEEFFETLKVLPDFHVRINLESGPYFLMMMGDFHNRKRGELYKVQTSGAFHTLTFLPEDVVEAIKKYDMTDFLKRGESLVDRILEVQSGHRSLVPNQTLLNLKNSR